MGYYLITFASTHAAIATQNYLKEKISFHVMPTLREISNSCGISIRIDNTASTTLEEIKMKMQDSLISDNMYKIYFISPDQITEIK